MKRVSRDTRARVIVDIFSRRIASDRVAKNRVVALAMSPSETAVMLSAAGANELSSALLPSRQEHGKRREYAQVGGRTGKDPATRAESNVAGRARFS